MSNNLSRHRKLTNPGIVGKLPFLARLALSASCMRRIALGYVDRGNLLSVLLGIRSPKATDPRDRVYASMGSLEDGNEDKYIEVDYSKDVELIFKEWALKRIRRTRTLDVLSACVNDHQKSESFPSWAPNLRVLQPLNMHLFEMVNHIPFVLGDPYEHVWYSAAGKTRTEGRTVDERGEVLELEEIHVGTIVKIISFTRRISQLNNRELATQLPKAMDELESQLEEHFGTKIVPGAKVYKGLVDALLRGNRGSFSQDLFMSRYGVWRGHTPPPADFEVLLSEEDRRKACANNLELTIGGMMRKSDLFVTENGDISCVARQCLAQAGHEIFVLFGGNAPFLLEVEEDGVYELRGSVYMHDYVNGQAISKLRTGELDAKKIRLA